MAITKESPSLKWRIKYARKDLVRKAVRDANRELTKASMVAHMEPQASNESETIQALERLPLLFKNKVTQKWTESVLRIGQRQTMVNFNQTPRQFNSKLIKVCKYAHSHQQPKQRSHAKELKLLKEWDSIIANESTTDDDVQLFIDSNKAYINEIVDNSLIKYQGRVLKDFVNSGVDRYTFNELMHARYIKLEQELKEKSNELS